MNQIHQREKASTDKIQTYKAHYDVTRSTFRNTFFDKRDRIGKYQGNARKTNNQIYKSKKTACKVRQSLLKPKALKAAACGFFSKTKLFTKGNFTLNPKN